MSRPTLRSKLFLQVLRKAQYGTVWLTLPDGRRETYGTGEPRIDVEVRTWKTFDLLFSKGDLGVAEAIMAGDLVVADAVALVEWACLNDQALSQALHGSWLGTLVDKLNRLWKENHREGAKKNIMAHYDLGNEFYRLWLDKSMSYSSALFSHKAQTLESAQMAKYDRIIQSLNIKPGDRVLEIGCGWGGFFSRAVEQTGCKVTAVMNSPQQARHNEEKIAELGMQGHVELRLQDYRDIEGRFDKVVSIEMIEAVGVKYWPAFFGKVEASLEPRGQALIQGITIREDLFYSYRQKTDFIQRYVFPGGMLLTNEMMRQNGASHGLKLTNIFEFAPSYAETLRLWRENFHHALEDVKKMGFDDRFLRLWNLYLAYCEGAFRAGRINVGQFLLER